MRVFQILVPAVFVTAGCVADDYEPLSFTASGDTLVLEGVIDGSTLDAFQDALDENPDTKTLVLAYIGGSADDEANIEFSRMVHERGLNTHVPADGMIASGGTDLFLAGNQRTVETGACIGVHSWGGDGVVATELPRMDAEHSRYLDYYEGLDIPTEFYWFTLEAAPAEGMHWMTAAEIAQFELASAPVARTGSQSVCDAR